ncbi:MAG: hypothetical protein J7599_21390 [Niabella sp.]|nr:hypothetical protein [Niabella sp.]
MAMVQQTSTFAEMVDKLRFKSEEELKQLYLIFFQEELENEWKTITKDVDMEGVSEEVIVATIMANRYKNHV